MQTTSVQAETEPLRDDDKEHLAKYLAVLAIHDWRFERADDYTVWKSGKSAYDALRIAQPLVDPDFVHWNRYAPEDFHVHVVTPLILAPGGAS